MKKVDTITIQVTGSKKFRQKIMDLIYEALMDEDLQFEASKIGNGINLESTLEPSEDVMF